MLRGREAGRDIEGAGHLMEKPRNKAGSLAEETGRRYFQASLLCQSSDGASKPSGDSSSTCHQTAVANAATRCKCH